MNETEAANASHGIKDRDDIDLDDDELFTEKEDLERDPSGYIESVSDSLVKILRKNEFNEQNLPPLNIQMD